MVLAFLSALFLVWREAKREYLDEEKVTDIFLLSFLFFIASARFSYIFLYPAKFGFNIFRILLPTWMPGFYLYGGLVGGLAAFYLLAKQKDIDFAKLLDIFTPAVLFSAFLYKIGQFLDGSLVGLPTETFLGLPVVGEEGRFVPVALFEAVLFFIIFIVIVKVKPYFAVKRKIKGALFLTGLALAAFFESVMFLLLRDKVYLGMIPVSLFISTIAFGVAAAFLYKKTRSLKEDMSSIRKKLRL